MSWSGEYTNQRELLQSTFERRAEIEPWLLEVERRFQTDFAFDNSDAEAAMEELSLLSEDIAERRLLVDRHRRTV